MACAYSLMRTIQLDCPSDGHWDYAGILPVEIRVQIRDQFWDPQPKLHGAKYLIFFVKSQNELVTLVSQKGVFQGGGRRKILLVGAIFLLV